MEVSKPIFCVTSLIRIYITVPYQYLLINVDTSHDTLLRAFLILYQEEPNNIKRADMLNIERQIFTFVVNDVLKKPLLKECILRSINSCRREYKKEVVNRSCNVLITMLAERFSIQRGALFGFGPKENKSIGTLLQVLL